MKAILSFIALSTLTSGALAATYTLDCAKPIGGQVELRLKESGVESVKVGQQKIEVSQRTKTIQMDSPMAQKPVLKIEKLRAPQKSLHSLEGEWMSVEVAPVAHQRVQLSIVNSIGKRLTSRCSVRAKSAKLISHLAKISRPESIFDQAGCLEGRFAFENEKQYLCKKGHWKTI